MIVYYITFLFVVIMSSLADNNEIENVGSTNCYIKQDSNNNDTFFLLACCVLIFVSGFRFKVGTDFGAYYFGYMESISKLPTTIRTLNEPGLGILSWLVTRVVDDGQAVIFVSALLTIALPMVVIHKHNDKLVLPMIMFMTDSWIGSFNGIRQYLAASIVFGGYSYLKNKEFAKYAIIIFVAFLFHRSAIVVLLFYFLVHRKINIENFVIAVCVTLIALYSYRYLFSIANYVMDSVYSTDVTYTTLHVNRIRVIASAIPATVFLLLYWGKEKSNEETFYLNLTIIHALIRIITMNSALLYRIGIYTELFQLIAIPQLLKGLSVNNRRVIIAGLLFMSIGMGWYEIIKSSSLNSFHFMWQV